ncbi:MAG TPA: hypothetical protein VLH10_11270, partial [Yinghuangia sp.]|nr:hypothetical protein [Yinghuangia sp.]
KSATYTAHLLPAREDHVRYRAEAGVRFVRRLRTTILTLSRSTLRDGQEHTVDFDTFTIGLQRDLLPAEQAWSNLMDPREAARILNTEP